MIRMFSNREWLLSNYLGNVGKSSYDIKIEQLIDEFDLIFPDYADFVDDSYSLIIREVLPNSKFLAQKSHDLYMEEMANLKNMLNEQNDFTSVTLTTKKSLTIKSPLMLAVIKRALTEINYHPTSLPSEFRDSGWIKREKPKKRVGKVYVQSLKPIFDHLKKHNPQIGDNITFYKFLREYSQVLGFDFNFFYPGSIGDEPFRQYFNQASK